MFPPQCLTDCCTALEQIRPQQVLLIAPREHHDTLNCSLPAAGIKYSDPDAVLRHIDTLPIHDAVVVLGVIENLDKPVAENFLSRLRDLHARHLFVLVPIGAQTQDQQSQWQQADLLALGLTVYKSYTTADANYHWYRFELENYKATPDWLNSKYWANPELFGKFRW